MATRLVNAIEKGIVIDHIRAGLGIQLYNFLKLDRADFTVAAIFGAQSRELGLKDIIKIEDIIDLDYTVIGLIDDGATVNIIEKGAVVDKRKLTLPERVENVLHCKNPRCITSVEPLPHIFNLRDAASRVYSCAYCEEDAHGIDL